MSAKNFKIFIFYSLSVLLLSLLCLFILNPKLMTFGPVQARSFIFYQPNFFKINPVVNFEKSLKTKPSQFRNGAERTGFYEVKFNPLNLEPEFINDVAINHGGHRASKSTPMSLGEYIVVAGDQGLVQVFKNKKIHWRLNLYNSNLGFHGTPILFDHYAIIGEYTGRLYLLNLMDKKIIWVGKFGDSFGATPWLENSHLYYNVETVHPNGYIAKVDLVNLKTEWVSRQLGNHSHSSPAVDHDNLYLGDNANKFQALSKSSGKIIWTQRFGGPIKSTPAIDDQYIYISSWDGHLYCLNKKNGSQEWRYPLGNINQSSMALDTQAQIGVINNKDGIHKIDLKTGKQLIHLKMKMSPESKKSSPIILNYNGKKFVATACFQTEVCIFDFSTFKVLKKYTFSEGLSSQIGVGEDYLMIALNKNTPLILLK